MLKPKPDGPSKQRLVFSLEPLFLTTLEREVRWRLAAAPAMDGVGSVCG